MDALARPLAWLNAAATALGEVVLAPLAFLPGWLGATLVAVVTGVLMLVMFKYTSPQQAIKRVRDDIKANLLALKLFRDSARVIVRAQARVFRGAMWLFIYSLLPVAVMMIPVCLVMAQLSLWYQTRPLRPGEETVITLKLNDGPETSFPEVALEPTDAVEVSLGPVRGLVDRTVFWNATAKKSGRHRLTFRVDGEPYEKELAIGEGYMPVSVLRPAMDWLDVLLYPAEPPFPPDSPVQSIAIDHPPRDSWTSGSDSWIVYWFVVSLLAAFALHKPLNVNF